MYTDSTYVINGIREWIHAWRRRGWKTVEGNDVLNRDLWEQLVSLVEARGKGGSRVALRPRPQRHLRQRARRRDRRQRSRAVSRVELYRGRLLLYGRPILDIPEDTTVPGAASVLAGEVARRKPHSYLSVVDGKPMRHATWADCERRVKGRSGARFKKAMSAADERAILEGVGTRSTGLGPVTARRPQPARLGQTRPTSSVGVEWFAMIQPPRVTRKETDMRPAPSAILCVTLLLAASRANAAAIVYEQLPGTNSSALFNSSTLDGARSPARIHVG